MKGREWLLFSHSGPPHGASAFLSTHGVDSLALKFIFFLLALSLQILRDISKEFLWISGRSDDLHLEYGANAFMWITGTDRGDPWMIKPKQKWKRPPLGVYGRI